MVTLRSLVGLYREFSLQLDLSESNSWPALLTHTLLWRESGLGSLVSFRYLIELFTSFLDGASMQEVFYLPLEHPGVNMLS